MMYEHPFLSNLFHYSKKTIIFLQNEKIFALILGFFTIQNEIVKYTKKNEAISPHFLSYQQFFSF
ncbi:MAG TPA: hypothetical protein DIS85_00010 [Vagococcus sp.]|nr:hypothetical protein [Vagococcus sp.]